MNKAGNDIHIGTSGWSYRDWKGDFYDSAMKAADWLPYYAAHFGAVEVNSSFYHLPRAQTVANWIAKVPEDFRFCPKISKYITHIKRLKDTQESLGLFFGIFSPVKKHLGPVLMQLPPSLQFDYDVVSAFFDALSQYSGFKFALEARHVSWLDPAAIGLLEKHNISLVISQSGVGYPYSEQITAHDVYVRFHGPGALYSSSYTTEMLEMYADKMKGWLADGHAVWAFFNNTMKGVGLRNAEQLAHLII